MSAHPILCSMGITSIEQISRYSIHSECDAQVLKIYYQRPEGSPLPRTKKFQFNENSQLSGAIKELDSLIPETQNAESSREQLADELEQLQQVMTAKMSELRRQLKNWS